MPSRAALALCALVVFGWLAVLVRDHHVGETASPLLYKSNLSAGQFDRYMKRLRQSQFLDPDTTVDLGIANFNLARGRTRVAAGQAERIVRAEPENLRGGMILYGATIARDPAQAARAAARIRSLNPLVAGRSD
jgi:hypothetical protein